MIEYFSESEFTLKNPKKYTEWIINRVHEDSRALGRIAYIFCDDAYLLNINREYLNHDYFTDIITFPYNQAREINGDIFISVERVKENAAHYEVDFDFELSRVMIHGILHLLGWKDDTPTAKDQMRNEENRCLRMFHVKQK